MVGVPRSKGCISCRASRKGCDARRPACSQCLQRGVECPGYATNLKIVFVQPDKRHPSVAVRGAKSPSRAVVDRTLLSNPNLLELLPSFANTAFRSQTYERFVTDYAPHSVKSWPTLPTNLAILPSTSWLQAAIAVAPTDAVLNNALTALALAQVGRTTKRSDLLHGSRKLYFEAVSGLNRKLKHQDESLADTTLAAASALSIYEMQEGSREKRSESWASHVDGASALIHLRGRVNFSTPLSNRVFLGVQIAEFIAAIGKRKRSVNASLWSQVYQDSKPESTFTSPMQLFEILHCLPQIMKEGEAIGTTMSTAEQGPETTKMLIAAFMRRCQDFEMRLVEWFEDLESKYQSTTRPYLAAPASFLLFNAVLPDSSLCWFELSTLYSRLPHGSHHRIFPFFICFVDPDIAFQTLLHWTGLLLLHSTLLALQGRLRSTKNETAAAQVAQYLSPNTSRSLAILIAQSLEYFLHPDMGLLGTNLIGFPLSATQRFFQHTGSKEILWLDVIFQRMREMKSGLSGFLDDMARGNTVKLASTWNRKT